MIYSLYLINILNVILAFIFQILFVKILGATSETDAYYLSMMIIVFVNFTVVGFITDLFIQIYNDIKVKSELDSKKFINRVFTLVLIIGLITSGVVYFSAPAVTTLFAMGFDADKIEFTTRLVRVLSFTLVFSFAISFMNATLNANFYMLITYLTNMIIPVFNIFAITLLVKSYGIETLIYSYLGANIIAFIVMIIYLQKTIGINLASPFGDKNVSYLLKQNIPMRMGIIVYFLRGPITTNVISYFPAGYLTLFNYAEKLMLVLHDVTNSIILQILHVKSCNYIANKNFEKLIALTESTIKVNTFFFIILATPVVIFFIDAFRLLFSERLTDGQILITFNLFIALLPFYLLMTIELPFTLIAIAMKEGVLLLKASVVFVVLYILFVLPGLNTLGIYVVPVALFLAQLVNAMIYILFIQKTLNIIDKKVIITIVTLVTYTILLIFINSTLKDIFEQAIYINIIFVIFTIIFIKKNKDFAFEYIKEKIN